MRTKKKGNQLESKRQKKKMKTDDETDGDRISKLPNSVLHHVFSFLDTKVAVQTSILSSRWRYLCTSLPYLNFSTYEFYKSMKPSVMNKEKYFPNFVDEVLIINNTYTMKTFCIRQSSYPSLSPRRMYSWILGVIRHNVQKLDLTFTCDNTFNLPHCVFMSETLVELKLNIDVKGQGYKLDCLKLNLPYRIALPSLKLMHLERVCFVDEELTVRLFGFCPVLESLTISNCEVDSLKNLSIICHKLQRFCISTRDDEKIRVRHCNVSIRTPNLTSFRCGDSNSIRHYFLQDCPAIENVWIDSKISHYFYVGGVRKKRPEKWMKECSHRMRLLLWQLTNVKSLTLSEPLLEFLSESLVVFESMPDLPTEFSNLRYLKLGGWISRESVHAIMHLLMISPKIQTLVIDIPKYPSSHHQMNLYLDETTYKAECLEKYSETRLLQRLMWLHHLKLVEMHGVQGSMDELIILEILLEIGVALDEVLVFSSKREAPDRERRLINFKEKLLTLPHPSSSMEILFS